MSPPSIPARNTTSSAMGATAVIRYNLHFASRYPVDYILWKDSPYRGNLSRVLDIRARAHERAPGPEVVAEKVMQVLKKKNPRFSYVVGGIGPVLAFLNRVLPEKLTERIQRRAGPLGSAARHREWPAHDRTQWWAGRLPAGYAQPQIGPRGPQDQAAHRTGSDQESRLRARGSHGLTQGLRAYAAHPIPH